MFVKKPRSSEAYEGDTVIIMCEVIGDPKPEVVWLRDFLKASAKVYHLTLNSLFVNILSFSFFFLSVYTHFNEPYTCQQFVNDKCSSIHKSFFFFFCYC